MYVDSSSINISLSPYRVKQPFISQQVETIIVLSETPRSVSNRRAVPNGSSSKDSDSVLDFLT